jgi:ribose 5-phosphate isomerase A
MPGVLDDPARAAAVAAAVTRVEPGITLGLGSGRAVFGLVEAIATRWPPGQGGAGLRVVTASQLTEALARAAGFHLVALDGEVAVDHSFDGADEVDDHLGLVKGGGGALLREKLVMGAAGRVTIMAEHHKRVPRLGHTRLLPVEVVRFGWQSTMKRLAHLLPELALRIGVDGRPLVTDEGHYLLDGRVPPEVDLHALAAEVKATLGVVEHGLFLDQADEVLLGRANGTVEVLTRGSGGAP